MIYEFSLKRSREANFYMRTPVVLSEKGLQERPVKKTCTYPELRHRQVLNHSAQEQHPTLKSEKRGDDTPLAFPDVFDLS